MILGLKITKPAKTILWGILALLLAAILVLQLILIPQLPSAEQLRDTKLQVPLRVYSRNLKLIGEFGEKRRIPLTLKDTPLLFIQAVLAAEDDRFYQHGGVDIAGLIRAASELLSTGRIQSGGSTITMQVARNFFLSSDQTFARKFNEILLAILIEREFSKDEILELYINKIYLGNRAYGLGAAAQIYYGSSAQELSLAQLAMIAGLPKAPSTKNPISNPEAALTRRNWILGRMLKLGYIDQAAYEHSIQEKITAQHHELKPDYEAPYVAEMARQYAVERFGENAYTDGYRVITTIDEKLQQVAQHAVQNAVIQYDKRHGYRGPEQSVAPPENLSADEQTRFFTDALKKVPTIGNLIPAIFIDSTPEEISVLTASGVLEQLPWKNIQSDTAPYVNEDRVGEPAVKPSDIFRPGDLIRLLASTQQLDGHRTYQLAQKPLIQGALVSLNPDTGAIISLVGGFDFYQSKYNRIIQAKRQPGSSFKPFFYTKALESGFTPATLLNDSPIVFEDANLENAWRPENSGGSFLGQIRLRKALYLSRNLVSIRLLKSLGVSNVIESTSRFGFDPKTLPNDLSLALGSMSIPPLEIATGYASFANGGYKIEPFLVDHITDLDNNIIFQHIPLTVCDHCEASTQEITQVDKAGETTQQSSSDSPEIQTLSLEPVIPLEPVSLAPRIIDEQTVYLMDSMLKDVIRLGTATRARSLQREDIAGKTGTTNGPTDVWFSGYSPHLVTTTWLGFDNNQPLGKKEYGGTAALPMWIEYMEAALQGLPERIRPQPEGLVTVRIDEKTGLRARPDQTDTLFEIFRSEDAPTELTPVHSMPAGEQARQNTLPDDMF